MLLRRVVAPYLQANCYVLAPAPGGPAVVVDPGAGAAPGVRAVLAEERLEVAAVYLTHGHPDHVWDAAEVAGEAPVLIAEPDAYRLEDPTAVRRDSDPDYSAGLATQWRRPADVRTLPGGLLEGGGAELAAGIAARVVPAPGHTEGSTLTLLGAVDLDLGAETASGEDPVPDVAAARDGALGGTRANPAPEDAPVLLALAGDVIFQGSIGRSDLLGGDPEVMMSTLRTLGANIDPATVLLPGHGPATWWGRELRLNAFVRQALLEL